MGNTQRYSKQTHDMEELLNNVYNKRRIARRYRNSYKIRAERLFVIDDIGYVNKDNAETQVLFEFIVHRCESGSLIITSNKPFSQTHLS